jgi:AraC family transcriptional regulator
MSSRPPEHTSATAEYTFRINRVLAYIEQHLADDLSLGVLARESFFSPFHFHRVFQGIVGETPLTFVKRVRLERAASMLLTSPAQSITQVGLACGFPSPAAFSRSFRERFGAAPREYRENRKNRIVDRKNGKDTPRSVEYLPGVTNHTREILMNLTIKDMQSRHVGYVANLEGYESTKIRRAWDRLCSWAGPLGLLDSGEMIGVSFDDPDVTPKHKCRYYACITIPADLIPPKDIGVLDLPGGRHAVVPFDGTTAEIQGAYSDLYARWLPQSGFEPADTPCFEIYHSTPENDPEGHFVMEICLPLRAMGGVSR